MPTEGSVMRFRSRKCAESFTPRVASGCLPVRFVFRCDKKPRKEGTHLFNPSNESTCGSSLYFGLMRFRLADIIRQFLLLSVSLKCIVPLYFCYWRERSWLSGGPAVRKAVPH